MWQYHDGVKWDMVPPHWDERLTDMWFNRGQFEPVDDGRFESCERNRGTHHQWQVELNFPGTDRFFEYIPYGSASKQNPPWLDDRPLRMVTVFRTATSNEGAGPVVFPGDAELVWQYGSGESWQNFEPSNSVILNRALEEGLPLTYVHVHPNRRHTRPTRYTVNFTDYTQTSDNNRYVRPIRLVAITPGDHRPQP